MNNIVLQKTWVQGRPVVVDNLLGTAFTGEAGAHTFKIRGVDAAQETVTISGTITGKLLAANNVTVSLSGSIEDGCAVVTLTDECYDVPGRFIFSVYATSGSTTLCLYCAVGNVLRTDSQVIAYPTESLPNITSLMADLEQILADWPADYSQLQSDVSSLKSAIIGNETSLSPIQGYINVDGTAFPNNTAWNHVLALVDNLYIDGAITLLTGNTDAYTTRIPGIIFFDADMSPIAGSAELVGRNAVYKWTTVPDGAVYVCLNTTNTFTVKFRSLNNTAKKLNENKITPEMFQAVGDGTADDTNYLQAAINYCITNNLPLSLTYGKTYKITNQIAVNNPPTGFHIYGNGATVKVASGTLSSNNFAMYFNKTGNTAYARMNYFTDFTLDCSAVCAGIQVDYGYDFTFENVSVINCSTVAIYCVDGGECYFNHISIKCNHNSGNSTALQIMNSDYHFTDVAIIDADRAVYNAGSNMFTRVHAWNTANCAGTYYFVHNAGYPVLVQCHADTYETAYYRETDRPLMLIGCDYYINSNLYDSTNTPVVFKFATSARAYTGQVKCVNCMFDALSTTVNMAEYSHKIQLVNCTKKGTINRYYNGESLSLVSGVTATGLSVNSNRIWVDNDYQEFDLSLNVSGLTFASDPVSIGTIQTNIFIPSSFMVFPCMLFADDYSTSWTPGYITINNSNGIMQVKANTAGTYKKLIANFRIHRPMGVYQG